MSARSAAGAPAGSRRIWSAWSASIAATPTCTRSHSRTSVTCNGWSISTTPLYPAAGAACPPPSLLVDRVDVCLLGAGTGGVDAPALRPQPVVLVPPHPAVLGHEPAGPFAADLSSNVPVD